MDIRRIQKSDIEKVMDIYEISRKFMIENGNATQWPVSYPSRSLVEGDVKKRWLCGC